MGEVGQRFQDGKAFVPQLLMAGRAMKGALELLKPLLQGKCLNHHRQGGHRDRERRLCMISART